MFPENLYSRTIIIILLSEYHVVREASRLQFCTLNKLLLIRTRKKEGQHRANSTPHKFNKSLKIPRGRVGSQE